MSGAAAASGATPICRRCGTVLRPVSGGGEVQHGTVAGVAAGPVGWVCPRAADEQGHDRRRPSDDEVAATLDGLDVARRTAIRGTLRCGVCDTPFVLPGRRTSRTVTITGAAPAVTITLDVPVLRCTEDAVDNLPPEALTDARAVVTGILATAAADPDRGAGR